MANGMAKRVFESDGSVEGYFIWLKRQAAPMNNSELHSYNMLCEVLFDIPFRWFVETDENRVLDGLMLRDKYADLAGGWLEHEYPFLASSCSFLEVVVGMSKRARFLTMDEPGFSQNARDWAIEMLDNCGLMVFSDNYCLDHQLTYEESIRDIAEVIMLRAYPITGEGSFFPLKTRWADPQSSDLGYLMSLYIQERVLD